MTQITSQIPGATINLSLPSKEQSDLGSHIKNQFPILSQSINGHPLVYLDSAATAQKPQCVIDAITRYYEEDNANVKRGMHALAERSTEMYEAARKRVQQFLKARKSHEIVFTKNTTEAVNLIARSWGEANLQKGDTVLLTLLEHHSSSVPWLQLKEKMGIDVQWVGIKKDGTLNMSDLKKKLAAGNVKMVVLTCVSNVLGTITPYEEAARLAHRHGALTLLDAAQLAPHAPINVQQIGCDFLVFSGHKVYGPLGIGVLYGREDLLREMPPFMTGGSMVREVTTDRFVASDLPEKFEAGTPAIAEACGLHKALDFLDGIGWSKIQEHEKSLMHYARETLAALPFVQMLGPTNPDKTAGCISFVTPGVHPHDLTDILGQKGICLRAGHHCCQPLHDALGHKATTRLSVGVYNTKEDLDRVASEIQKTYKTFPSVRRKG